MRIAPNIKKMKIIFEGSPYLTSYEFIASVLSGSDVPTTSRSRYIFGDALDQRRSLQSALYIESKVYPDGYPNGLYQVTLYLHQTEHIKQTLL